MVKEVYREAVEDEKDIVGCVDGRADRQKRDQSVEGHWPE